MRPDGICGRVSPSSETPPHNPQGSKGALITSQDQTLQDSDDLCPDPDWSQVFCKHKEDLLVIKWLDVMLFLISLYKVIMEQEGDETRNWSRQFPSLCGQFQEDRNTVLDIGVAAIKFKITLFLFLF